MTSSAAEMIARCFRHQHPEAYGEAEVREAVVPVNLRYGAGSMYEPTSPAIDQEEMGDPEARAW